MADSRFDPDNMDACIYEQREREIRALERIGDLIQRALDMAVAAEAES